MTLTAMGREIMRLTRWGRTMALALPLAVLACDNPPETLGPENAVTVTNQPGHFRLTIQDMQNITTTMTFQWDNPGVYATIDHQSFTPHGTTMLIVTDAAGQEDYRGKTLYQLEDRTLDGTPGTWTVEFDFDKSVGRIDVTLDAADTNIPVE